MKTSNNKRLAHLATKMANDGQSIIGKVEHFFTVDTSSNCHIFRLRGSRYMGEIDMESRSTHNFNALFYKKTG